jgi:hypothetical protein
MAGLVFLARLRLLSTAEGGRGRPILDDVALDADSGALRPIQGPFGFSTGWGKLVGDMTFTRRTALMAILGLVITAAGAGACGSRNATPAGLPERGVRDDRLGADGGASVLPASASAS